MKRWIDLKILGRGLGILILCCIGVAVWLAIAGAPPPPPQTPSISVPVQAESAPAQADAAQQTAAVPSATPVDDSKLPPPPVNSPSLTVNPGGGDKRPRIAIIVTELGLNQNFAAQATKLPAQINLAFLPFGNVAATIGAAKAAGHEVLLDLPMEPSTYPDDNPGSDALMINVGDLENQHRLDSMLVKEGPQPGDLTGVVAYMGSRFIGAETRLKPILESLKARGLLFVDNRENPLSALPDLARAAKLPFAVADLQIDAEASHDAIDQNLAKLEAIAKEKGLAIGLAGGYPITLDRLGAWTEGLAAKGIVLAPISAVVTRP